MNFLIRPFLYLIINKARYSLNICLIFINNPYKVFCKSLRNN